MAAFDHTFTHAVALPCMRDQPVTNASTCTTHSTRKTAIPPTRFEPAIQAVQRPQIYASGRAATGIGRMTLTPRNVMKPILLHTNTPGYWILNFTKSIKIYGNNTVEINLCPYGQYSFHYTDVNPIRNCLVLWRKVQTCLCAMKALPHSLT
jgi:hypothetical protein